MSERKNFVVGLDCGVNTGVAIYDREQKNLSFKGTQDFWKAYRFISLLNPEETIIVIERPKKNFVYARNSNLSKGALTKVAFNSGENNRESSLLVEGFEKLGFEVRQVTPTDKKWTAADLKRFTGITDRTNEHVRDAIRLCWQT